MNGTQRVGSMPPASVEVRLTAEDIVAAHRFHFRQRLKSLKFWLTLAAVWSTAALAFVIFIIVVSGPSRIVSTLPVFVLLAPLVIIGILSALYAIAIPMTVRRAYAQQKSLRVPAIYTIADDALLFESETGSARLPWQNIHAVRENDVLFLVYEWEEQYRLLPKRAIPTDHLDELRRKAARGIAARRDGLESPAEFEQLDNLVRAYLNQDLHEFYETVEDAVTDSVRNSHKTDNHRLLREMEAFEARYRDDLEAEFARRYDFEFAPRTIGQTVPQFFNMIRTIIAENPH